MSLNIHILIESNVSNAILKDLDVFMLNHYSFLTDIILTQDIELSKQCLIASRNQYNTECLLDYAVNQKERDLVLLLISQDTYIRDLNYVFGIGVPKVGSVISTFRLEEDITNLHKVVLHEVGHVFGLLHCQAPCAMAPSNSIFDIYRFEASYCIECQKKLENYK